MKWPNIFRFRYSLRALVVFVTLFMLWGGYHANRGWKQRRAEQILYRHGASISHWDARAPKDFQGYAVRIYEAIVYRLWGEARIKRIHLDSRLEPEVLTALEDLPPVEILSLQPHSLPSQELMNALGTGNFGPKTRPPPGALKRALSNRSIRHLTLTLWDLSDGDCHAIAGADHIESIGLLGCNLSERGFTDLITRPGLRSFGLSYCPVKGELLASVDGSQTLEDAGCLETGMGQEFARYLARCPNLQKLRLIDKTVDDEFVESLGMQPALRELDLFGPITDKSADSLAKMPSLEAVTVGRGSFSDKAAERLKRARPNLFISQ